MGDMGIRNALFALTYDRLMRGGERAGLAAMRAALLREASGDVLEVGAGTGLNLPHYGDAVRTLTVTEPDVAMLRRLHAAVERSSRPATVLRAPAEDLPFDAERFDTVVCTLVLCGVDDQPRSVREMERVLRPGGRLLFLEHVRADDARIARRQDRMRWLARIVGGCDCNRPTLTTLERSGLVIEDVAHDVLPAAPSIFRPMILGCATRRAVAVES
jgi:ubiquinone/menaquinone biosynthesis C-methylase UbiE